MLILYLGAVLVGEEKLAGRPAPSNWVDQAKIRAREAENALAAALAAPRTVTAGTVAAFALVDAAGRLRAAVDHRGDAPGPEAAAALLAALAAAADDPAADAGPVTVVGFDAPLVLRVAALRVLRDANDRFARDLLAAACAAPFRSPIRAAAVRADALRVVDPYPLLVPSSQRGDVDAGRLCRYLGVDADPSSPDVGEQAAAARGLAEVALVDGGELPAVVARGRDEAWA